jgi:hypothetical protein
MSNRSSGKSSFGRLYFLGTVLRETMEAFSGSFLIRAILYSSRSFGVMEGKWHSDDSNHISYFYADMLAEIVSSDCINYYRMPRSVLCQLRYACECYDTDGGEIVRINFRTCLVVRRSNFPSQIRNVPVSSKEYEYNPLQVLSNDRFNGTNSRCI